MTKENEILEHYTNRAERIYELASGNLTKKILDTDLAYIAPESIASYNHALAWCSGTLGIPSNQKPYETIILYLVRLILETDYLVGIGGTEIKKDNPESFLSLFSSVDMAKSALALNDIPTAGVFKRYEYFCILGLEALMRGQELEERAYSINGNNSDIGVVPPSSFCEVINSMSEYMLAQRACQEVVLDYFCYSEEKYIELKKLIERPDRVKAADATNKIKKEKADKFHSEWQSLADEIWKEPGRQEYKKSDVARIIQTRMPSLPADKYNVKYIAANITKPAT